MPSRFLKLKDQHPSFLKLEKIFSLMDELNIGFTFNGNSINFVDTEQKRFDTFYIEDIEENHSVTSLPPSTEYKVLVDNPEYFEKQELERKQYLENKAKEVEGAKIKAAALEKQKKIAQLAERKQSADVLAKQIKILEEELNEQ